jgi:hypothetical protein
MPGLSVQTGNVGAELFWRCTLGRIRPPKVWKIDHSGIVICCRIEFASRNSCQIAGFLDEVIRQLGRAKVQLLPVGSLSMRQAQTITTLVDGSAQLCDPLLTQQNLENRHVGIQINEDLMNRAYERVLSIFADSLRTPPGVDSHLSIELNRGKRLLDVKREVVWPIAFALEFFGENFPKRLIQKLRNMPQLPDTLLDLFCLGCFAKNCKVFYEPKLADL